MLARIALSTDLWSSTRVLAGFLAYFRCQSTSFISALALLY